MSKLVWRVKVVADLGLGAVSETEVARIERDDFAVPETVGLSLAGGKQLTAAIQAEIVGSQAVVMGEKFRWCEHCRAKLWSKGYYPATFRSLFGDVPVKVRRLSACRCRSGSQEPRSFAAMMVTGGIAPELAYVTAKLLRWRRLPGWLIYCPNSCRLAARPVLAQCAIAPCGSGGR
jgi:hypothetical protein